jgi:hypothetical protein
MSEGKGKVFGIGLSRTGAKSLNQALEMLGYRSLFVNTYPELEEGLSSFEAFTHTPLAALYQELDRRFPGSKFILTTREQSSWLASCQQRIGVSEAAGMPDDVRETQLRVYGIGGFDRETFRRVYDRHLAEVAEYFAARPGQLLTIDLCAGEGWEKLCPFLGRPVPSEPFPHAVERFRQPAQVIKRNLVRYLKLDKVKRALTGTQRRS